MGETTEREGEASGGLIRGGATYSPDDNKLRLYPIGRLDAETYDRVRKAGFKWAPKQELFVAPAWTPEREDLLLELVGEIDDEDTNLVARAEVRAERFEGYSERRGREAKQVAAAVERLADGIPLGQPILVGHHSERRARKDAERIESGMRQAVRLWDTARYWTDRASGAVRAAKYKELPAVRARRIRKIDSDRRRAAKQREDAERGLALWSQPDLTHAEALRIAGNVNAAGFYMPLKEGDREGVTQRPSASDVLGNYYPNLYAPRTLEEVIARAKQVFPLYIARADRWLAHYDNRLAYERAMLDEAGGTVADRSKPEKGGACRCWASPGHGRGWSYIRRVNKVSVTVDDNWGNGGRNFPRTIPFDKLLDVMSAAEVEAAREAGRLLECEDRTGFFLRESAPAAEEPTRYDGPAEPAADEATFDALRSALKGGGVQVVSAPQLFPTPEAVGRRVVELARLVPGHRVLEPSAGTFALGQLALRAVAGFAYGSELVAVEINVDLAERLRARRNTYPGATERNFDVRCADFLTCTVEQLGGRFDRVLMNPPFERGADIKHILHAAGMLKPGGLLVAVCAAGPRQRAALEPLSRAWIDLPAGSFRDCGTNVNTALVVIEAAPAALRPGAAAA